MKAVTPKRTRALVLVAVAALALAACSSSKKTGTGTSSTTASSGGSSSSGLKLGFFGALTGPNAQLGINIENGEKLAISQYNATNPANQVTIDAFDVLHLGTISREQTLVLEGTSWGGPKTCPLCGNPMFPVPEPLSEEKAQELKLGHRDGQGSCPGPKQRGGMKGSRQSEDIRRLR